MHSILIADDNRITAESISGCMQAKGYKIITACDGLEALDAVIQKTIHLMILNTMMSDMYGIGALMKVIKEKGIPLILIVDGNDMAEKIPLVMAGTDDCFTVPVNYKKMVARVKQRLSRSEAAEEAEGKLAVGGLSLDTGTKIVMVNGNAVRLTPIEYRILELLCKNRGKIFSANEIYRLVWDEDYAAGDNTIAVHIRHIREKIEANPKEPRYIKSVWGLGYRVT